MEMGTWKLPETLEQWRAAIGTKIDVTARLTVHHLSRDDAPIIKNAGEAEWPPLRTIEAGSAVPGRTKKVLIYQQFPSMSYLTVHVREIF